MHEETRLVVSGRLADATVVRSKVEQDIAFLTDRISTLKNQSRPNQVVIDTYQTMLDRRLSVLKWLQNGYPSNSNEIQARSIGA